MVLLYRLFSNENVLFWLAKCINILLATIFTVNTVWLNRSWPTTTTTSCPDCMGHPQYVLCWLDWLAIADVLVVDSLMMATCRMASNCRTNVAGRAMCHVTNLSAIPFNLLFAIDPSRCCSPYLRHCYHFSCSPFYFLRFTPLTTQLFFHFMLYTWSLFDHWNSRSLWLQTKQWYVLPCLKIVTQNVWGTRYQFQLLTTFSCY